MFKRIFTKERLVWLIIVLGLLATCWIGMRKAENLFNKYEVAVQNNKAFVTQLDSIQNQSNVFKVTINQLEYFNDSIVDKLQQTQKQLGIKDKQIKQLNYLATELKKTDTITLIDTIFKDPSINIDTIIGDKWINTHMVLQYPNMIALTPTAISKKQVLLYSEKETINPPSKCFFIRWFQKKHTVLKATVTEENPYITSEDNVFIEIVK